MAYVSLPRATCGTNSMCSNTFGRVENRYFIWLVPLYIGEREFTVYYLSHYFSPHRDLLSRISFYHHRSARYQDTGVGVCNASPLDGRFVTYSKEGAVAFWDTKMSLLKSYHVSSQA